MNVCCLSCPANGIVIAALMDQTVALAPRSATTLKNSLTSLCLSFHAPWGQLEHLPHIVRTKPGNTREQCLAHSMDAVMSSSPFREDATLSHWPHQAAGPLARFVCKPATRGMQSDSPTVTEQACLHQVPELSSLPSSPGQRAHAVLGITCVRVKGCSCREAHLALLPERPPSCNLQQLQQ